MSEDIEKDKLEYKLKKADEMPDNHKLVDELAFYEILKSGDVECLERNLKTLWPKCPVMIKDSVYKSEEYITVATLVLVSRCAIVLGMTSTESFQLSDIYLQKIAKCNSVHELVSCREHAVLQYAKEIRNRLNKEETNQYVEDCKKYIAENIFDVISLDDVAANVGLSKNYLARIFKKQEPRSKSSLPQTERKRRI